MAKSKTDKKYLEWLSYQPSCLDGAFSQYQDGIGRNIACHVRRSSNSGTGYKPPFSAVPMTDAQHKLQSTKGEVAVLVKYYNSPPHLPVECAKEFFEIEAKMYLFRWKLSCKNNFKSEE